MNASVDTQSKRLNKLNYNNSVSLIELSEAFTFVNDGEFFHTVDGSIWKVWQLGMFSDDTLSEDDEAAVTHSFSLALDKFPEGSSGQIIKYVHSDIRSFLYGFASKKSSMPYAESIQNAVIDRQIMGATKGFMANITPAMQKQALDDITNEINEQDLKESLTTTLEESVSTGQYAHIQELYVCFRYVPSWSPEKNGMKRKTLDSILGALNIVDIREKLKKEYKTELNKFNKACKTIQNVLIKNDFSPAVVKGQGLLEILFRELNPDRSMKGNCPVYNPNELLREQIFKESAKRRRDIPEQSMFTNIKPSNTGWQINDVHFAATSLVALPRLMYPSMMHKLLKHNEGEGWYVINFHVDSQFKVRMRATVKKSMLNSKEKMVTSIPFVPYDEEHAKQVRSDIDNVQASLNPESPSKRLALECSYHVVMKDTNKDKLLEKMDQLATNMFDKGFPETDRGDAIIHHCMPLNFRTGAQKALSRSLTTLTPYVSCLSPLFSGYSGLRENGILMNNGAGSPVNIKLIGDHVPAGHTMVLGGTGSGKSFFVNNLLQQQASREDTKIVMIDKGGSYLSACEAQDGQYINLVLDDQEGLSPVCINPYHIPPKDDGTPQNPSREELEFILSMILAMININVSQGVKVELEPEHITTISEALQAVYDARTGKEQVTHSKLLAELTSNHGERGERLASMLYQFSIKGPYGRLFDGELEADWDNPFIVVETDKVAGSKCMPVIMMVLFYQVNAYFKYRLPQDMIKIIGLDEAWSSLSEPLVAASISGFILELRKYNALVMLISQTMQHFKTLVENAAKGGAKGGLIENIKHFFFLACAHTDHVLGKEVMNFSDEDIDCWANVSSLPPFFSECFYLYRNKQDKNTAGKIRLYSNPVSLWLSTTHPGDKKMRQEYQDKLIEQGHEPAEAKRLAVEQLAQEFPYGSSYKVA